MHIKVSSETAEEEEQHSQSVSQSKKRSVAVHRERQPSSTTCDLRSRLFLTYCPRR